MSLEILSVDKAIVSRLTNDIELKALFPNNQIQLFTDTANEDQSNGFWITFELLNAQDTNTMDGRHVMSRPQYVIRVCNRDQGYQACKPYCDRIYQLMCKTHPGETDDVWVGRFIRRHVFRGKENVKDMSDYWISQQFDLIAYPTVRE